MECVIERAPLYASLALLQGVTERRNTVPILAHILVEAAGESVKFAATDLEVGIKTELKCRVKKKGALTVQARKFFEVVREAQADEVSLHSLDNDWIEVGCGRAKFKMLGLDPRSFPAMPSQDDKPAPSFVEGMAAQPQLGQSTGSAPAESRPVKGELSIDAGVLGALIDKTLFASSPDEARYNLSGVFVEASEPGVVRMVATDGHRLSMADRAVEGFTMEGGAILPRKGLNELKKLLEQPGESLVRLVLEGSVGWLKRGVTELSMRLVQGEFPDYRAVLPKSWQHEIALDRDVILSALKRVAIFSNERYRGIKLALSPGKLLLSSVSPELGEAEESLEVEFQGEELVAGFNANYLVQAISTMPAGEPAVIGLTDDASPAVLMTRGDTQYMCAVMPMRL